jgi:hypothetical protein
MKAAKKLYELKDERITKYERRHLLKMLSERQFHSPEVSDDQENGDIAVYDYSWRSVEVCLPKFFGRNYYYY